MAKSQQETPELERKLSSLDKDPGNKALRYEICEYCIENKLHEQAIKQLLDVRRRL